MHFGWTDEQRALNERMQALGQDVAALPSDQRMAALADGGVLGLAIDAAHGGGGESLVSTAFAFEGLGKTLDDGGLLLAAGAHLFGVALTLQRVGTEEQKARWLPSLCAGECIGTVATTEANAGSDVAAVEATLTESESSYVAQGHKRYVTFADRAQLFLFVARAVGKRGLTTALVQAHDSVRVDAPLETLGLRGARLAPVHFDDTPVAATQILGRPGAGMAVFQIAMTFERALVLAFRIGAMERDLRDAIRFVKKRKVGATPLTQHQAATHRIANMHRRLEAARLAVYRAAWLLDEGKRAQSEAALAKWQLADAAVDNAMDAMRLRGGAGYLSAAGLGTNLDDAIGGSIHSGTGDVLANIVAAWLGC